MRQRAQTKAVADEFTKRCCHAAAARTTVSAELAIADDKWLECNKALIKRLHQDKAMRTKAVANEVTEQRCHMAAAQTAASAELALAEERCCHDAATQMAMSAASSLANERHHHDAAAQAAESAALLLAEERRQHEALIVV